METTVTEQHKLDVTVATEIRKQLFAGGVNTVMSWGAQKWGATNDSLSFRVNGHKFKGFVEITYTPMDVYTVKFVKVIDFKRVVCKELNNVYCDMLVEVIDEYVERLDSYKR